jgi:4-diphosphocytidyl-2-C-methyl-D-erythritol kinase
MQTECLAPAKVNLFLHVGPLGDDGYHPLASLVTFADVGDVVRVWPSHEPGFAIEGPFADELAAFPASDNLVVRARDAILATCEGDPPALRLVLDKRLPIASGLGGGSADAAAALALIARQLGWGGEQAPALKEMAAALGSDVPMCLAGTPSLAEGRGDVLSFPTLFPDLDAVLVNPMQPSPTGAVYRAFDAAGATGGADVPEWTEQMATPQEMARFLSGCRNDLEAPAISLQPAIGEVLAALNARPETLFARMSGSGATCFALCANERDRRDLAFAISAFHPTWWVQGCRLAGTYP